MEYLIVNILLNEKHSLLAIVKFEKNTTKYETTKYMKSPRRSRDAKESQARWQYMYTDVKSTEQNISYCIE